MAPTTPKKGSRRGQAGAIKATPRKERLSKDSKTSTPQGNKSQSGQTRKVNTSKRAKTRDLVRWTIAKDVKVLLALHKICRQQNIILPYEEAAKHVAPYFLCHVQVSTHINLLHEEYAKLVIQCTGNALSQHLDKLTKKVEAGLVPQLDESNSNLNSTARSYSTNRSGALKDAKGVYSTTPDDIDPDDGDPDGSFGEQTVKTTNAKKIGRQRVKSRQRADSSPIKDEDSEFEEYVGGGASVMRYTQHLNDEPLSDAAEDYEPFKAIVSDSGHDVTDSDDCDSNYDGTATKLVKLKVNRRDLADLFERPIGQRIIADPTESKLDMASSSRQKYEIDTDSEQGKTIIEPITFSKSTETSFNNVPSTPPNRYRPRSFMKFAHDSSFDDAAFSGNDDYFTTPKQNDSRHDPDLFNNDETPTRKVGMTKRVYNLAETETVYADTLSAKSNGLYPIHHGGAGLGDQPVTDGIQPSQIFSSDESIDPRSLVNFDGRLRSTSIGDAVLSGGFSGDDLDDLPIFRPFAGFSSSSRN